VTSAATRKSTRAGLRLTLLDSHEDADRADAEHWAGTTMEERLSIVEALREQYIELHDDAPARLQRVLAFAPLAPGPVRHRRSPRPRRAR
jgi:hypothetical protein